MYSSHDNQSTVCNAVIISGLKPSILDFCHQDAITVQKACRVVRSDLLLSACNPDNILQVEEKHPALNNYCHLWPVKQLLHQTLTNWRTEAACTDCKRKASKAPSSEDEKSDAAAKDKSSSDGDLDE